MKYYSTRDESIRISAAEAIAKGLAADGGLFVPECLPHVDADEISALCAMDYKGRAKSIMAKFLDDFTAGELERFVNAAYGKNFDCDAVAPLGFVDDKTAFLELWHGPTCAFKDMALQMLPHLLTASLKKTGEEKQVCILVATSGDTGKAALEGFADVEGTKIFVFYPKDGVSDIQRLQMVTQSGKNVGVCAVVGNFDDAQTGVKKIFGYREFAAALAEKGYFLSSANSINWGRLLPQIVYYFSAYCDYVNCGRVAMGEKLDFCVPTGNFGNILAGWYAKQMGLPVGKLICASNENNVLTDFINTGVYDKNRAFHTTISPSMDILVSSNLERLLHALAGSEKVKAYMAALSESGRYDVDADVLAKIKADFCCGCCDDAETKANIRQLFDKTEYLMDTHTAVAYKVLSDYRYEQGAKRPAVVVSTASPYKFAADVLDALGVKDASDPLQGLTETTGMPVPAPLSGLDKREVRFDGYTEKSAMRDTVDEFLK
ncbi:MAG: threonine synthase [Oscillospiraceae bacterium]|nr:threonine synthase [Oscillospiraceae bacterium]